MPGLQVANRAASTSHAKPLDEQIWWSKEKGHNMRCGQHKISVKVLHMYILYVNNITTDDIKKTIYKKYKGTCCNG